MFFIHPQWEWGNDNAYWSTQFNAMFFGDGDQLGGGKLPLGMDIIAHEYTHGVTNFEAGLIYETQSGALDEGFSDFFGCMVDREDWLLAEDIIPLGNNPGKIAMRDMSQPGNPQVTDQNPAVMAEYRNLPIDQDNGGVHINCGIPSYMMYLLAEGGDYAISKEKTEQIIYQARNNYLTQRSQFIDFRRACESAARDLYGENSAEVQAVQKAADAIGLQEAAAPSSPSTPGQVVSGDEQIIFLLADPSAGVDYFREDYYYQMVLNAGGENYSLAPRYVANTRPAVSGDGKWGLYVDALNDIYWTDGYQEERWTDTGIVRTIAMSKNLRYIAFTTIDYAPYIYLIDTKMEQTVEIPLRIPLQSQYEEYVDLYFADVMTFNFRGDHLIFDGVSDLKTAGGETVLSWGLYSLRLSDFSCEMVMPAVPGEQFGDPIFAHTDDSLLLADLVVSDGRQAIGNIVSLDFSQGKIGLLMENTGVLAKPSFRGDDQHILFLSYDPNQQVDLLVEAELNPDRLSLKEGSLNLIIPSGNFTLQPSIPLGSPIGFREGEYESQEGRIAVSEPIHFGNVPVGEIAQSTVSIVNQGNADLEVLSISIAAEHADWFTHQGLDGRLAPGAQYDFMVACRPMQEGAFTGELHIQSTDLSQPDAVVALQGVGIPSSQASPTPTKEPSAPTPTPTQEGPAPTPTLEPSTEEFLAVYEFDQLDLAACGWKEQPGGFVNAAPGSVLTNLFMGNQIPTSNDKVGIQLSVNEGQIAFIHAVDPIATGGSPVLIRMDVRASGANAAVGLAALKGNLSTGAGVDASIATNIPANASRMNDQAYRMTLIYEPDGSENITPVIQVAGKAGGMVSVFVDRLEVLALRSTGAYSGSLFNDSLNGDAAGIQASAGPDAYYEFDQIDMAQNGWRDYSPGFSGMTAGQISANNFVGQMMPSSMDKVGVRLSVNPGQVAFMHTLAPIQTNGRPILIRAAVKADRPEAAVALAALQGNLVTGEGIDESIVTHIPASAASMVDGVHHVTLLCPSNASGIITPIIQLAAAGQQGPVNLLVDRVEIYRLNEQMLFSGSWFNSDPEDDGQAPVSTPTSTPISSPSTPTPVIEKPTSTPLPSVPTPTNTPMPGAGPIAERKPNNSQAQPQEIGSLAPGGMIQVNENVSSGGVQGDQYIGDVDGYAFTLTEQSTVSFSAQWNAAADLDYFLFANGQQIAAQDDTNNPAQLSQNLAAGRYVIIILSYDNPADYVLTMSASEDSAHPNNASLLKGKYYSGSGDMLWIYEFDGQGNYQYLNWNPISGEAPLHYGTYDLSPPSLILNHSDGEIEQLEFIYESATAIYIDGDLYTQ